MTWDSSDGFVEVYKDGVKAYTGQTSAGKTIAGGGALVFAQEQDELGGGFERKQAFAGTLDEVYLYNRVLSQEEIQAHCLDAGLVGHWRFDEGAGPVALDSSGPKNHASLHHVGRTQGFLEDALDFKTRRGYVIQPKIREFPTEAISTAFWIKTRDDSDAILSYATGAEDNEWLIDQSQNLRIRRGKATVSTGVAVNDGHWHFVVVTWQASNGKVHLYRDGSLVFSGTLAPGTSITSEGALVIGQDQDEPAGGFDTENAHQGMIDEVRIYDRVLSSREVRSLHNSMGGLVAIWTFDESSETIARDSSGNGIHAKLHNVSRTKRLQDQALLYEKKGAYAKTARISTFPNYEITSSFWIRTTDEKNSLVSYASEASDNDWKISDSGNLTVTHGRDRLTTAVAVNDDRWHAVVVTWQQRDGSLAVYKDGTLVFTGVLPSRQPIQPGGVLVLGQDQDAVGRGFDPEQGFEGLLDQVRIYRRALAVEEVQRIYRSESGLVGLWQFDEASGNVALDRSGSGNDAHLRGADWTKGLAGAGLGFDKNRDFAMVRPVRHFPSTALSALFWVKTTDSNDGIISYASSETSNAWSVENSEDLAFRIGKPAPLQTGVAVNDGLWHHVAMTWDSSDGLVQVYKDGVKAYTGRTSTGKTIAEGGALVFAQEQDTLGGGFEKKQAFAGTLDEVYLYNRVLSEEEIHAHCINSGLAGHWSFDEGTGSVAVDSSSQSNHASIHEVGRTQRFLNHSLLFRTTQGYVARTGMRGFPSDAISTAFWIRTKDSLDTIVSYASEHSDQDWVISNSSTLSVSRGGPRLETGVAINDGRWHHVVVTWSKSDDNVHLYIDGRLLLAKSITSVGLLGQQGTLILGQDQDEIPFVFDKEESFQGELDSVRIYGRRLASDEIQALYRSEQSLVLHWNFDEAGGKKALDRSGSENHGMLQGASRTSGRGETAVAFAADDHHLISRQVNRFPSGALTASFWIKTTDEKDAILSYASKTTDNDFLAVNSSSLNVFIAGQEIKTDIAINDGEWHFVAVAWRSSDGKFRVFKDGKLAFSGAVSAGALISGGGTLVVGQEQDQVGGGFSATQAFSGKLDDIRFYRRMLSEEEVQEVYFNHGLIGHWTLDERNGVTAHDSSGHNHHLRVQGTKWKPGRIGGALRFLGTSDYAKTSKPVRGFAKSEITTTFWVKTTDSKDAIFSYASEDSSNDWLILGSDELTVVRGEEKLKSTVDVSDDSWHFVAITWRKAGGAVRIYKDGVLGFEGSLSAGTSISDGGILVMGQDQDALGGAFHPFQAHQGFLDDVRVFRRSLNTSEVRFLYALTKPRRPTTSEAVLVSAVQGEDQQGPQTFQQLVFWLDAAQAAGEDQEPITRWQDRHLGLHALFQSNHRSQPRWVTKELNQHAVVRFDGENDTIGGSLPTVHAPFTLVALARFHQISSPSDEDEVLVELWNHNHPTSSLKLGKGFDRERPSDVLAMSLNTKTVNGPAVKGGEWLLFSHVQAATPTLQQTRVNNAESVLTERLALFSFDRMSLGPTQRKTQHRTSTGTLPNYLSLARPCRRKISKSYPSTSKASTSSRSTQEQRLNPRRSPGF